MSSAKLEVHNILQCHQRRTDSCAQNVGPAVPGICLCTDIDTQTDCNTPHPYWVGVNSVILQQFVVGDILPLLNLAVGLRCLLFDQ